MSFRLLAAATLTMLATACTGDPAARDPGVPEAPGERAVDQALTVYARDREIAEPLFERFERETGIEVRARWGNPIELAEQIIEDGADSPADVFYGPVGDALGPLAAAGRLARLSAEQLDRVPEEYRSPDGTWVGTSGRAHVVVYNTDRLREDDLPDSIEGFTEPAWRGRIGWDPTSRSLQSATTALRQLAGDDAARAWLAGIQANQPAAFEGAVPIVTAVAAGQIVEVGFASHYYLYDLQAGGDAGNVAARFYDGDAGGLLNVAGVGIVEGTDNPAAASALVDFLLSQPAQRHFAEEAYEIPLLEGVEPPDGAPTAAELTVPDLDVQQLEDLQRTRELLREVGIIR